MNYGEIADKVNGPIINNIINDIIIRIKEKAELGFYELIYETDDV